MDIFTMGFQGTAQWILQHGYFFIFLLMLVEGPVVTAAAAFGAALHIFNVWLILLLSILGNLIPDIVYYLLGYWGRDKFINKYGHYFGLTKERMAKTEALAESHSGKSLFIIKMIPLLATPGLIAVGAARMNLRKYIWWCTIVTVPTSLAYLVIGYYFGAAYATIDHYLHLGIYLIIAAAVLVFVIIHYQKRILEWIAGKFQ